MDRPVVCLDSGIWIKFLTEEEPAELSEAAADLVQQLLNTSRLVAPAFAWAEVGSVLRKKVRQGELPFERAAARWREFSALPITFRDALQLRMRAWDIAERYNLPTLYDAAFLACIEVEPGSASREFWTVDLVLGRSLQPDPPPYLRILAS